ncbi:unnamed protein product [Oikopleura dioica]|uniref:Uncharacterized protein n=1 Tax=Oikopleura dioica TaxID=34765 RepID=E4X3Y4_OIKDI|nr:unnamed protein product [Oikopleura dioica]
MLEIPEHFLWISPRS